MSDEITAGELDRRITAHEAHCEKWMEVCRADFKDLTKVVTETRTAVYEIHSKLGNGPGKAEACKQHTEQIRDMTKLAMANREWITKVGAAITIIVFLVGIFSPYIRKLMEVALHWVGT